MRSLAGQDGDIMILDLMDVLRVESFPGSL